MAKDQVIAHLFPAEVKETVLQTQLFIDFLVGIIDGKRQNFAGVEHLDGLRGNFDLPGGKVRVGRSLAEPYDTRHLQDPFKTDALAEFGHVFIFRIDHDLGQTVAVPQIHKIHTAMISITMDPAGQGNGFSGIGGSKLSTSMRLIHIYPPLLLQFYDFS